MAIFRISPTGVTIAQPGRDVDDGERYLNFSSRGSSLQIYTSGSVAVSGSGVDTGAPSPFNDRYRRMTVPLGKTFASPPLCLFLGKWNSSVNGGLGSMIPLRALVQSALVSGSARYSFEPVFVRVTTSSLEFWTILANVIRLDYLVVENTLG